MRQALRRFALTLLCLLPSLGSAVEMPAPSTSEPDIVAPVSHFLLEVDTGVPLLPVKPDEAWLYIDLKTRGLLVFRGEEVIWQVGHVAIGKNGAGRIRFQGSKVTPIGTFRIERINGASRFHTFFGINYPNPQIVEEAIAGGLISNYEAQRIQRHYDRHRVSLPNTSLGGHIGIHGLGGRSAFLHKQMDWTDGCLAVTDDEIRQLSKWVGVGTQVLIEG